MKKYKVIKEYKTSGGDRMLLGTIVNGTNEQLDNLLNNNGFIEEVEEDKVEELVNKIWRTEYKGCYVNEEGYLIQVISTEEGYIEKKYGPLQLIKD